MAAAGTGRVTQPFALPNEYKPVSKLAPKGRSIDGKLTLVDHTGGRVNFVVQESLGAAQGSQMSVCGHDHGEDMSIYHLRVDNREVSDPGRHASVAFGGSRLIVAVPYAPGVIKLLEYDREANLALPLPKGSEYLSDKEYQEYFDGLGHPYTVKFVDTTKRESFKYPPLTYLPSHLNDLCRLPPPTTRDSWKQGTYGIFSKFQEEHPGFKIEIAKANVTGMGIYGVDKATGQRKVYAFNTATLQFEEIPLQEAKKRIVLEKAIDRLDAGDDLYEIFSEVVAKGELHPSMERGILEISQESIKKGLLGIIKEENLVPTDQKYQQIDNVINNQLPYFHINLDTILKGLMEKGILQTKYPKMISDLSNRKLARLQLVRMINAEAEKNDFALSDFYLNGKMGESMLGDEPDFKKHDDPTPEDDIQRTKVRDIVLDVLQMSLKKKEVGHIADLISLYQSNGPIFADEPANQMVVRPRDPHPWTWRQEKDESPLLGIGDRVSSDSESEKD